MERKGRFLIINKILWCVLLFLVGGYLFIYRLFKYLKTYFVWCIHLNIFWEIFCSFLCYFLQIVIDFLFNFITVYIYYCSWNAFMWEIFLNIIFLLIKILIIYLPDFRLLSNFSFFDSLSLKADISILSFLISSFYLINKCLSTDLEPYYNHVPNSPKWLNVDIC